MFAHLPTSKSKLGLLEMVQGLACPWHIERPLAHPKEAPVTGKMIKTSFLSCSGVGACQTGCRLLFLVEGSASLTVQKGGRQFGAHPNISTQLPNCSNQQRLVLPDCKFRSIWVTQALPKLRLDEKCEGSWENSKETKKAFRSKPSCYSCERCWSPS